MTPQELKNSILQLAVQGKLVPQRPEEGSAEELLAAIRAQKQFSDSRSSVKKKKSSHKDTETQSDVPADEIPFEIPETWKWVGLKELSLLNPKNQLDDVLDVSFIPMALIDDGYSNHHNFEVRKWKDIKKGFTHFSDGDIGVAKITPCFQNRKSVVFSKLKNGFGAGTTELSVIRPFPQIVCARYLLWFFKSAHFISKGMKSFTGTAGQQRIHKDYIATSLIPLPPLAEQKRIVAKIEELLPLCERYGNAYNELQALNKRVPGDLQKSLLQLAVQGKLVPQRPEEGSAEELLTAIRAQKQSSDSRSTVRKKKNSHKDTETRSDVPADEIPFEIPKTWKWVRLGEMVEVYTGKKDANAGSPTGPYNFFTCSNQPIKSETYSYDGEFLIMPGNGANIGVVIHYKGMFEAYQRTYLLENKYGIFMKYLKYHLESNWKQYNANKMYGSAIPYIKLGNLTNYLVALPPLAEQKRIVAKLEELLPLCNQLSHL